MMLSILLALFTLFTIGVFENTDNKIEQSEVINVHFVAHSHMDAGWLKTYDDYFEQEVQHILRSVFQKLSTDKKYKYTLGDIAFFRRYYYEKATQEEKQNIKNLIGNGQLEIVHGGLVSHDEATTNYADILRNFEVGLEFLWQEFGIRPKIGWQLDPFGHSSVSARMMAEMGMESIFMGRINEQDFELRKYAKNLEFSWKPEFMF